MEDYKLTQEECFCKWLSSMEWRIDILMQHGFTKEQAIEMLKVYMLNSLEDIVSAISNI